MCTLLLEYWNTIADAWFQVSILVSKANRSTEEYRMPNVEGWFRFAQFFL